MPIILEYTINVMETPDDASDAGSFAKRSIPLNLNLFRCGGPPLLFLAGPAALGGRSRRRGFSAKTPRAVDTTPLSFETWRDDVASGTVKWFNGQKGYGFIAPDGGGKDVFVHISAVEKAGYDGLPEGAKVSYDIIRARQRVLLGI